MSKLPTKTNEAFWWSLFSAGGVMAAMFIPVLILLTGFILPFVGDNESTDRYEHLDWVVSFWVFRIILMGIIVLCFFHCAHRIRHVLHDVGIHADAFLMVFCYASAIAGSILAGLVLFSNAT